VWLVGASLYWFSYSAGTIAPTDKDAYANFESRRKPPLYYARFQPFSFSLENTFPLVKLGQADKWQPNPGVYVDGPLRFIAWFGSTTFVRWFIWIQIVLGWLFTTLFLAAVSGIVQHE
jgi:hypothetical protein